MVYPTSTPPLMPENTNLTETKLSYRRKPQHAIISELPSRLLQYSYLHRKEQRPVLSLYLITRHLRV